MKKLTGVALFDRTNRVVGFVHSYDQGYIVVSRGADGVVDRAIEALQRHVGAGNLITTQVADNLWIISLPTGRYLFPGAPTLRDVLSA